MPHRTVAVLLDKFHHGRIVLSGKERVAQGLGNLQVMGGCYLRHNSVGLGQQLLHGAVGISAEGEHDVGIACRSAKGLFAQIDTNKR